MTNASLGIQRVQDQNPHHSVCTLFIALVLLLELNKAYWVIQMNSESGKQVRNFFLVFIKLP